MVIWWRDHVSHESAAWQTWGDAEDDCAKSMPVVMSVGFLYHQNREAISLMSTIGPEEHGGVLRILKRAIVRQIRLEPPEE